MGRSILSDFGVLICNQHFVLFLVRQLFGSRSATEVLATEDTETTEIRKEEQP